MHLAYPFHITSQGIAATATTKQHIEQLMEQLLFTIPGERVNLPDFGTGIAQLIFSSGSDEMLTATQFLIQGALQQWLGTLIQVQVVSVTTQDATLNVSIKYSIKRTQETYVASFQRTS